jgi:rubredoxin
MSTEPQPNLESASPQAETAPQEVIPPTPEELDRYECRACGYTYEPAKGDSRTILAGVNFADLPANWRCPVCGANTQQFSNVGPTGKASGFKENLNYGFGVNTLTPGQKNSLIFGALGLAVLFFLSLYGLQ